MGNNEKFETTKTTYPEEILTAEIQHLKAVNKERASEVLLYASDCKLAVIRYGKEKVWKGRTFSACRNQRRRLT